MCRQTTGAQRGAALLAGMLCLISILSGCGEAASSTVYLPKVPSLPSRQTIWTSVAGLTFCEENGSEYTIPEQNDTPLVLVYWASWCPSCKKGLAGIDALAEQVEKKGGKLLLINRLDGIKETQETALAYLQDTGIQTPTLFDDSRKNFDKLHLDGIPNLLVTGSSGVVMSFTQEAIPPMEELLSMLQEAQIGKSERLFQAVEATLLDSDGGIKTGYQVQTRDMSLPVDADVLSESQGLWMLYTARAGRYDAFDKSWQYLRLHMTNGGLAGWLVTQGETKQVNAAVDDLRICRALLWQGEQDMVDQYSASLLQYNVDKQNQLVDFYDFSQRSMANRLTLCYADFAAMQSLAEKNPAWETVLQNSLEVVSKGKISPEFPLYYSWYDYSKKQYQRDEINMAEQMLTLLHLSQVQKLTPETYDWLHERMQQDGYIYSRYSVEGTPLDGGMYESTAVYALLAMVAMSERDLPLADMAFTRMEELRVRKAGAQLDVLFGAEDGEIYSFDQLVALLAYQEREGWV